MFILNDYSSANKSGLLSLNLQPLNYLLGGNDIPFFIRSFKSLSKHLDTMSSVSEVNATRPGALDHTHLRSKPKF